MDEKLEELAKELDAIASRYNFVMSGNAIVHLAQRLTAAGYAKRADVVEECAKVADDYDTGPWGLHSNMSVAAKASEDIATQIRNLKDKP